MNEEGTGRNGANATASPPKRSRWAPERCAHFSAFGWPPPNVAAAFGPHNRPAHQKNGVANSSVGSGARTASTSDASPTRANAPPDAIADVDPRSASSSTGWVPNKDGVKGSSASANTLLATM